MDLRKIIDGRYCALFDANVEDVFYFQDLGEQHGCEIWVLLIIGNQATCFLHWPEIGDFPQK